LTIDENYVISSVFSIKAKGMHYLSLKNKIKLFNTLILGKYRFLLQTTGMERLNIPLFNIILKELRILTGLYTISYREMMLWGLTLGILKFQLF
jgi:hypothetical protein